jgi:UDP-GlcNAc:undecaprenyl-phosphate GlcNAc-1-phosphate transferase
MELMLALIVAAVVTVVLIPLLEKHAAVLQVLDAPGGRRLHDRVVPRVGGIAMAGGAAAALLIWLPMDRILLATSAAGFILLAFGVWDDRAELKPAVKFLGQLIAVAIVVFFGDVLIDSVTFAGRVDLPGWIAYPLTFLVLLGVTNAINLADGLDGLAGGTTFLCCAALAVLSFGSELGFVTVSAFALMGALLGFLRYNSYPARIFMGDGGSQLLGFGVGILAIYLTQSQSLPYSAALPLLLLGLPILDMLTVIAIRLHERRSPFSADRNHLHHRLLGLGFDHWESVVVIYLLQALLFLAAWLLRYQSDLLIVGTFATFAFVVLALLFGAERTGWRRLQAVVGAPTLGQRIRQRLGWLRSAPRLPRWSHALGWACVCAYVLLIGSTVRSVDPDLAWLAAGVAVALGLAGALPLADASPLARIAHGAAFVGAVLIVYLDHIEPWKHDWATWPKIGLFVLLTAAVLLRLRLSSERRFQLTPMDVLVVFIALVVPNLPGLRGAPSNLGFSVAKVIVLFYAVELLSSASPRVRRWLWRGMAVGFAVLAVRGL